MRVFLLRFRMPPATALKARVVESMSTMAERLRPRILTGIHAAKGSSEAQKKVGLQSHQEGLNVEDEEEGGQGVPKPDGEKDGNEGGDVVEEEAAKAPQ